MDELLTA